MRGAARGGESDGDAEGEQETETSQEEEQVEASRRRTGQGELHGAVLLPSLPTAI